MNVLSSWNRILPNKLKNNTPLLKYLKELLKEQKHSHKILQHLFEYKIDRQKKKYLNMKQIIKFINSKMRVNKQIKIMELHKDINIKDLLKNKVKL
jgi:hypothetical protein